MKNRLCALAVAVFLLTALAVPTATAGYLDGECTLYYCTTDMYGSGYKFTLGTATYPTSQTLQFTKMTTSNDLEFGLGAWQDDGETVYTGAVGVYISYYMHHPYMTRVKYSTSPIGTYQNHLGNTGNAEVTVSTFEPSNSTYSSDTLSLGYSYQCDFVGSEEYPISNLKIDFGMYNSHAMVSSPSRLYFFFPSIRVVGTQTSYELDALEGIADQLAQQNSVLQAMYGDLVAVCNAIYEKTDSIDETMSLALTYLSSISGYLSGIKDDTSQIYVLLQNKFQELISTINTESDDIQAAIAQQTEEIIEYLDSAFSGSVGSLPSDTGNLENQMYSNKTAENDYKSKAENRFGELSATFTGFTGGTLSGVTLVSTLFRRVWDVLDQYVIVYTFPLYLGICLLIIGRLSRLAGRSHSNSKGDDDNA